MGQRHLLGKWSHIVLLHINYLDREIWGLVSWKAELPQKKGSCKEEVVMEKRKGDQEEEGDHPGRRKHPW